MDVLLLRAFRACRWEWRPELRGAGRCGGTARGRAAQREGIIALCDRVNGREGERPADVGQRGRLVVVEGDEANADFVAVQDVIALDPGSGGTEIEVRVGEAALRGDEEHEKDEADDAERSM